MSKRILIYILGFIVFLGFFVFGISSEQKLDTEKRGSIICFSCIGIG